MLRLGRGKGSWQGHIDNFYTALRPQKEGLQLEQGIKAMLLLLQAMSPLLHYRQREKSFCRLSVKYAFWFPHTSEHYGFLKATT